MKRFAPLTGGPGEHTDAQREEFALQSKTLASTCGSGSRDGGRRGRRRDTRVGRGTLDGRSGGVRGGGPYPLLGKIHLLNNPKKVNGPETTAQDEDLMESSVGPTTPPGSPPLV